MNRYCPNCLSNNVKFSKLSNKKNEKGERIYTPIFYDFYCPDCKWVGKYKNTLNYYKYLNIKRTKLIERMLNGIMA